MYTNGLYTCHFALGVWELGNKNKNKTSWANAHYVLTYSIITAVLMMVA